MIKVKLDKETTDYIKSKIRLVDINLTGIYFLKFNDTVVYVGQSKNIKDRVRSHLSAKEKVFNDFEFITCSDSNLNETETMFIYRYDPIFNKRDSLSNGDTLENFCYKNNVAFYEAEDKQKTITTKKIISVSIEESVLISCDEIVKNNDAYATRSHLITALILKEKSKSKKDK